MTRNYTLLAIILILLSACGNGKPKALEKFYENIEIVSWDDISSPEEDIDFTIKRWNAMPFMDTKRRIVKDLVKNYLKKGDRFNKDKFLELISYPLYEFESEKYVVLGYPIGKEIEDKLLVFFIIYEGKIYDTLFAKIKTYDAKFN
ncbi:MAG: hypothetical protein AB8B65_09425 [Kordia sp.]|uniref:hypothetical protein n=1 Tax=Kordia sp. TaxID=1965332 RepID=UPI00385BEA72